MKAKRTTVTAAGAEQTAPESESPIISRIEEESQVEDSLDLRPLLMRILQGTAIDTDIVILRAGILEELERLVADETKTDPVLRSLDLQELTLAVCTLAFAQGGQEKNKETNKTKVAVAILDGEPKIQVWTREDGSDARVRSLTDLERTQLFRYFNDLGGEK